MDKSLAKRIVISAIVTIIIVDLGWLAFSFFKVRRLYRQNTRERVSMGEFNDPVEAGHLAHYEFAKQFCIGKRVADIACGTGYGVKMLRTVAASVDGYDYAKLGQEYVINLEKEDWNRSYDVIVSFETIEHLANPDFFLANAQRSAPVLILSTPFGEHCGQNKWHKQCWSLSELKTFLEVRFTCEYKYQLAETPDIMDQLRPGISQASLVAVCHSKPQIHSDSGLFTRPVLP